MQAVASSRVPVLPVVHVVQVAGAAAMLVAVGVVAGAAVMLAIRWCGWAWTCGVPLLVAAPLAMVLGWRGAVCYDAAALSTVGAACGGTSLISAPVAISQTARETASVR